MNRIDQCFQKKKKNILSIYFTAGYPGKDDTVPVLKALDKYGADLVEIGMPFSDPVADGPVIQQSSKKSLDQGMSLKLLFEQLSDLRKVTEIPVVLMGYLNPVYKMGMDTFLGKCRDCGVDGLILPDFPPEEYEELYRDKFKEAGIHNILLVTPQTPEDRIRKLDKLSGGFLYMVSSYATTGIKNGFGESQIQYFQRIEAMNLRNPRLVGFGISNRESFETAGKYANGGIIGTAFINALSEHGEIEEKVRVFMKEFCG